MSSFSYDALRGAVVDRRNVHDAIRSDFLPSLHDFFQGGGYMRGSPVLDFHAWNDDQRSEIDYLAVTADVQTALDRCRSHFRIADLREALEACERDRRATWAKRILVYLACLGDVAARQRLAHVIAAERISTPGIVWRVATIYGLIHADKSLPTMTDYCAAGMKALDEVANEMRQVAEIEARIDGTAYDGEEPPGDELLRKLKRPRGGVMVVGKLEEGGSSSRREVVRPWLSLAGKLMPVVRDVNPAEVRQGLVDSFPWHEAVIDIVLRDIASGGPVVFRPTIFVGEPGAAKTSLARAIVRAVGLECDVVPLGGLIDGSVAGTSAQWSTARESMPLQLIRRAGSATVAMVWDEIEKPQDTQNGSAGDALLGLIEPSTARAYRDPALEVPTDLSYVSHFGTANTIDDIPRPLRDRFRILRVSSPGWQHIGVLTRNLLDEIAADQKLDRRFLPPLAQDELEVVRRTWKSGSLRQLRSILEIMIDGRERHNQGSC